jgi:hypothetical protein
MFRKAFMVELVKVGGVPKGLLAASSKGRSFAEKRLVAHTSGRAAAKRIADGKTGKTGIITGKRARDASLEDLPGGVVKTGRALAPRGERLLERMMATGALSSGALHGYQKASAGLSKNPYDGPEGSIGGSLGKGAIGGLLAALGIRALGKIHARKMRR